jgi:ankyrin repeat protein
LLSAGPTPLHLAVRCGSLDAVACLLANNANVLLTDEQGWAAIHHAAYYNQERILQMLIRRNAAMVELQAKNEFVYLLN